jgi:hypothetical protein
MHAHLNHIVAQQRSAELRRAAEQVRLAGEKRTGRACLPDPNPIARLGALLARLTARRAATGPQDASDRAQPAG